MQTIYDIQQYLKQFGTLIYTGGRLADLEMMEGELKELWRSKLVNEPDFQTALQILRYEIQLQKEKEN